MAIIPVKIKVQPGNKTGHVSRPIVAAVREGDYINKGDRGAYIVGVFACRDVASDGKTYSPDKAPLWQHCLFKEQWEAALKGEDKFTDEEKALILAGYELLKSFSHGSGEKAIKQPHVMQLINKWSGQAEGISRQDTSKNNTSGGGHVPSCEDLHAMYRKHFRPEDKVNEEEMFDVFERETQHPLHPDWRILLRGRCF